MKSLWYYFHRKNEAFVENFTCLEAANFGAEAASVYIQSIHWMPLNLGSGCILMFSVNLTFDKTRTMQFCYFYAKIATFWAINVWVFKSQFEYFSARLLHSSTLVTVTVSWVCNNMVLCSSWAQKYCFEYQSWISCLIFEHPIL